jgi:hypothetical protein
MKRGLVLGSLLSLILLVEIASAQSSFVDSITAGLTPQTVVLAVLFVVFFGVLYFSTSKIFKGSKNIAAVVSLALSLLIVYYMNQATDVGSLFSGLGIANGDLYTIGAIVLIAFIIFLFVKIRSLALLVLGGIFIAAAISGLVYDTTTVSIIGAILVIAGLFFLGKKKRNGGITPQSPIGNNIAHNNYNITHNYQIEKEKEKKIQNEKRELGQERDMAARARAMAVAEADYAQHEASVNAQKQRQISTENQIEQNVQKQITSNLDSLKQTYNQLQIDYNNIQRQNPNDPQLRNIFDEMVNVRNEIKRLLNR